MKQLKHWLPPGKNCGQCGVENCKTFLTLVRQGEKTYDDCPFFREKPQQTNCYLNNALYSPHDLLGNPYDFILKPLPREISARKIVLPFRSDLVEKMSIKAGDYVLGRPMGAGCPIPHVLKVFKAELTTGLLYTWVVGPQYSRRGQVKDVIAYQMIGFEGIATEIKREPIFGARMTFLPGFCMMNLNHTGLVNLVLEKSEGLHLRLEDIRILGTSP